MKHLRYKTLAGAIQLALLGIPNAYAVDVDALERRIHELESRLEKFEKATAAVPAPTAAAAPAVNPEVQKLTRKVNTLERKLEVQDEVTASNFTKLPKFDVGTNGFRISSQDGQHEVRIRGAVQADGHFFSEDANHLSTDNFELKQARIWLEGKVFKNIYYKIMPDFAASGNILPDAYLDYAYLPEASLLVGKFKPSLSLERLQGDSDGTFLERAFPTYLASNRDVGVQLHGAFSKSGFTTEVVPGPIDAKNTFTYQVGVMNGSGDDGSPNNNSKDTDDNKEFVGRLFAHPFQHTGYSWLEGFGVGVAGTVGDPNAQALKSQATPIGRTNYLDYTKTLPSTASTTDPVTGKSSKILYAAPVSNGDQYRIYPQAYWYAGPFGVMAEYSASSQTVSGTDGITRKKANVRQDNTAWQVLASWVVTGEDNSFGAVKPIQNFSPLDGQWGALQLAARWTEMNIDKGTFKIVDPSKSASHATAWTLGANWYLNSYALIRADYEQTSFDGGAGTLKSNNFWSGGDRATEHVFATRFQLSF